MYILQVTFVGKRTDNPEVQDIDTPVTAGNSPQEGEGQRGISHEAMMGAIAGGAIALVLLIGALLLVLVRRRRDRPLRAVSLNEKPEWKAPPPDDSLTAHDSLALKPQPHPEGVRGVKFTLPLSNRSTTATAAASARGSLANTHGGDGSDESSSAEEPPPNFSRSLPSFDAAMYDLDVIAEVASGESIPTNYQFSYDIAPCLHNNNTDTGTIRTSSGDEKKGADENKDDFPDNHSECQRVLQMS